MTTCICTEITTILQTVCSLAACFLAIYIPKKIKWEQLYDSLGSEYRSYDYGAAVQGIVEFWCVDCEKDVSKIKEKYEKRFLFEVYGHNLVKYKNIVNKENLDKFYKDFLESQNNKFLNTRKTPVSNDKTLHYQRRLLSQFYYQLDLCSKSVYIGKRRVSKDYTKRESNIIKILILINQEIEKSEIVIKDISTNECAPSENHSKGMNKYLSHIYSILKNSKNYME